MGLFSKFYSAVKRTCTTIVRAAWNYVVRPTIQLAGRAIDSVAETFTGRGIGAADFADRFCELVEDAATDGVRRFEQEIEPGLLAFLDNLEQDLRARLVDLLGARGMWVVQWLDRLEREVFHGERPAAPRVLPWRTTGASGPVGES
ncbi:hypothetical protein LBMAG42_55180 [Deltaproteobacteria bacterium]|nr:hypothetical protein LBMAG42_55180 [Deltaproteobacteria bacterium]